MTPLELIADAVLLGIVLSAAAAGLLAHLCWLALTDWHALGELLGLTAPMEWP
jgi:hypothetical protein